MTDPLHPYRAELRAHCYRMLGSSHDAEDVLQEVSLRAWRGADGFEGRSSKRTWLHRIAVNACLNELDRKERRVTPLEVGPSSTVPNPNGSPVEEVLWLEPLPDDPEEAAEGRETIELAFVAAIQHLAPNQRAALIMFDVLGFSAQEIAEVMDTTQAAVNSALARARTTIEDRLPETTQLASLDALGEEGQRELVARYTAALEGHDIEGMLALLTEDATWSMPPQPSWYQGHEAITDFLETGPFTVDWRHVPTRVNGQLAVACYMRRSDADPFKAYVLDVLDVRDGRIAAVNAFLDGDWVVRCGLPEVLPD